MNIMIMIHALNGLLMIAMPIVLAIILTRHWKMGWSIWWIGISAFIISQVGHIPFNWGAGLLINQFDLVYWPPLAQQVFNAIFLGLSAGVFEEVTRYLVLRFWAKKARSWQNGILFGIGHGGSEAIILGVLVLLTYTSMLAIHGTDLSTLVPSDQLELTQRQVQAYWSIPWYDSLLGAVERLFTIPVQICMAVLVMQAFTRKKIGWLFLAILYHAVVDGTVVFLMPTLGVYWTEALAGGFALLSLAIIFLLRQPEPALIPEPLSAPTSTVTFRPVEETSENLDNSRYQG